MWGTLDQQLDYLERRAKLLHRLVDVSDDELSRYLAQDAGDRAAAARAGTAEPPLRAALDQHIGGEVDARRLQDRADGPGGRPDPLYPQLNPPRACASFGTS
ncbi:hypothetical protein OG416_36485 (plasmid) [Streptomyces longwoodensis]|uniref:hypothetical protein n=1 Tax=Streptomyces longwoodensis TaxID=68231 RepID=UPI002F91A41B|nr:hypothetical protein OG416_36485 [Streptomyces longwoodensis]